MFKKLFSKGKSNSTPPPTQPSYETYITAQLNMKLQPMDRGEDYEDPLAEMLDERNLGETTGGGTSIGDDNLRTEEGNHEGVNYCDIEIAAVDDADATVTAIITSLENLGVAKGSRLIFSGEKPDVAFGTLECLALYLNGTDLTDDVYESHDLNETIAQCKTLMGESFNSLQYWEGSQDTAFYFYGSSYSEMKSAIENYIASVPGCAMSRMIQLA